MNQNDGTAAQKLVVYDEKGTILWQGQVRGYLPALSAGDPFWLGRSSPPRAWYEIKRVTTGLDTDGNMVVTELVVAKTDAPSERSGDSGSKGKKRSDPPPPPEEKKRPDPPLPPVLIDDTRLTIKDGTRWRNKKGTVELIFELGWGRQKIEQIEETAEGPEHSESRGSFEFKRGNEERFDVSGGYIKVFMVESHDARIMEFTTSKSP